MHRTLYRASKKRRQRACRDSRCSYTNRLALKAQGGAFDQSGREQLPRFAGPRPQCDLDFIFGERTDVTGDKARAEVAVGLQVTCRYAMNGGVTGQIDGIGNDSRRRAAWPTR